MRKTEFKLKNISTHEKCKTRQKMWCMRLAANVHLSNAIRTINFECETFLRILKTQFFFRVRAHVKKKRVNQLPKRNQVCCQQNDQNVLFNPNRCESIRIWQITYNGTLDRTFNIKQIIKRVEMYKNFTVRTHIHSTQTYKMHSRPIGFYLICLFVYSSSLKYV